MNKNQNKQTKKNRQKQGFIFLMLGGLVGLMAMAWGCGTEPAPKVNDDSSTKKSVISAQAFSEAAAIHIPGKTETFRGQNTLISFMPQAYREEGLQYASIFPFRLPLVFAQANPSILMPSPFSSPVDTSMERIRYIIRNTHGIYALYYDVKGLYDGTNWATLTLEDAKKDTVNWRFVFWGQDIMQQRSAIAPYELARLGRGGFNALVRTATTSTYDTVGYIPNRITARFYLKMQRFFPKGEYDSCMYYMDKLLKFYPLNNGAQYRELVNSGAEPRLDSEEKIKAYLDKVKAEENL